MQHFGGWEALTRIRAAEIREIRYVPLTDARQRFGQSVSGAIILVLTCSVSLRGRSLGIYWASGFAPPTS